MNDLPANEIEELAQEVHEEHDDYVRFIKEKSGRGDVVSEGQILQLKIFYLTRYREDLKEEVHELANHIT
jgi:hypothetical protein